MMTTSFPKASSERLHGVRGRHREPAELAAGAHRPEEHVHVADVRRHSDPVAEYRSAGVRRGGDDGDDADGVAAVAR